MGTTTKVFIVLNLIVALFTGTAAFVVFGKQIYWVEQTRLSLEAGNAMYEQLKSENNRLQAEVAQTKAALVRNEAAVSALTSEKETLIKENTQQVQIITEKNSAFNNLKDTLNQLNVMIEQKERRNGEIQARLDEEIQKNSAALKEAEWHQAQAIESAAELREAENEMMQLAKSNAEMVRRVALLSGQVEKYVQRYGADPVAGQATEVAISGRVMQVEPSLDLVILSVGEKDKVAKGMEFVISRGDSYIAKVRVANVYDNMCSARIVGGMTKPGETIQVSDVASTLN